MFEATESEPLSVRFVALMDPGKATLVDICVPVRVLFANWVPNIPADGDRLEAVSGFEDDPFNDCDTSKCPPVSIVTKQVPTPDMGAPEGSVKT